MLNPTSTTPATKIVEVAGTALNLVTVYGSCCRYIRVIVAAAGASTLTIKTADQTTVVLTVWDRWEHALNVAEIVSSTNVTAVQLSF